MPYLVGENGPEILGKTTATRTDRLWLARQAHTERLAMLRVARSAICGCLRCGDQSHGVLLDGQIRRCIGAIAYYNDRICEWACQLRTTPERR
jgi:hypothetical protein